MYNEITNCRCNAKPFINLIPEAMIKYFIYCRKSSEDEERQVLSIEAQLHELREYAKQQNLFVVKEFYESKTAKEPGREVFNEMLGEIEKGVASGILAWNPDRLARNSIDGGKVIYFVDTLKIVALKFPTFWLCKPVDNEKELSVQQETLSVRGYPSPGGALRQREVATT